MGGRYCTQGRARAQSGQVQRQVHTRVGARDARQSIIKRFSVFRYGRVGLRFRIPLEPGRFKRFARLVQHTAACRQSKALDVILNHVNRRQRPLGGMHMLPSADRAKVTLAK